jgi:hypothetical protein
MQDFVTVVVYEMSVFSRKGKCIGTLVQFEENVANKETCLKTCQETEGCKWFTYAQSYSGCLLMADCGTLDESCTDCTSGEVKCEEGKYNCKITSFKNLTSC